MRSGNRKLIFAGVVVGAGCALSLVVCERFVSAQGMSSSSSTFNGPDQSSANMNSVIKPTDPPPFDPATPPAIDPSKVKLSTLPIEGDKPADMSATSSQAGSASPKAALVEHAGRAESHDGGGHPPFFPLPSPGPPRPRPGAAGGWGVRGGPPPPPAPRRTGPPPPRNRPPPRPPARPLRGFDRFDALGDGGGQDLGAGRGHQHVVLDADAAHRRRRPRAGSCRAGHPRPWSATGSSRIAGTK